MSTLNAFFESQIKEKITINGEFIDRVIELSNESEIMPLINYLKDYMEPYYKQEDQEKWRFLESLFYFDLKNTEQLRKSGWSIDYLDSLFEILTEEVRNPKMENRSAIWFREFAKLDPLSSVNIFDKIYPKLIESERVESFLFYLSNTTVVNLDSKKEDYLRTILRIEELIHKAYEEMFLVQNAEPEGTPGVYMQKLCTELINNGYEDEAKSMMDRYEKTDLSVPYRYVLDEAILLGNPSMENLYELKDRLEKELKVHNNFACEIYEKYVTRVNQLINKHQWISGSIRTKYGEYIKMYDIDKIKGNPSKLIKAIESISEFEQDFLPAINMVKYEKFDEFAEKNEFPVSPKIMKDDLIELKNLFERADRYVLRGRQKTLNHPSYSVEEIESKIAEIDKVILEEIETIVDEKLAEVNFSYELDMEKIEKRLIEDFFKNNAEVYRELVDFDKKSNKIIKSYIKTNRSLKAFEKIVTLKEALFTSQWLWDNSTYVRENPDKFRGIDMTYQVAQYFKLVEILLSKSIAVSSWGEQFSGKIKVGDDNYFGKATMWRYRAFINPSDKTNVNIPENKLPIRNENKRELLFNKMEKWTNDIRNGLSHKDGVFEVKRILEIRDSTQELVILMLEELRGVKSIK